jgi:stage III sporulation protein AA
MGGFEQAVSYLSEELQRPLKRMAESDKNRVQEIRLRSHAALTVSLPDGEKTVDVVGVLSDREQPLTVFCTKEDVEKCFYRLCEFSVHSHTEEIRQGFITAKGGFRVGVSGTSVVQNGQVVSMREIRSLCLRVAKRHDGCADALKELFEHEVPSILIAGEPSAGKTSVLRDIGMALSEGRWGQRRRVAVVDERGEIAGVSGMVNAEVLTGIPKAIGILQAVRTLAPEVVLIDELGTVKETEAIIENLHAGVAAIATAHCKNMQEAVSRDAVRLALQRGAFRYIVFLEGRQCPGCIREIVEVNEFEMDRRIGDRHGGCVVGHIRGGDKALAVESAGNGDLLVE